MKGFLFLVLVSILTVSFSTNSRAETPKETCGVNAPIKYMRFRHQANLISDIASLEFKSDGGFILYDESGPNHYWHVETGNYSLGYRIVTAGTQTFSKHTFATMSRNWVRDFNLFVNSMNRVSGFVIESEFKDATIAQIESALNSANKIFFNTLARGQEAFLNGQQGQQ